MLKKEQKSNLGDRLDPFVKDFMETFLKFSYNNHMFAFLALHLILGRCTYKIRLPKDEITLDGRISFWYLSPPSSGKSTPYNFVAKLLRGLGENDGEKNEEDKKSLFDVDDVSDAVLIGYDNEEGIRVKGLFDRGGVVHWDEAAMLLNTGSYGSHTKSFIQKALNVAGDESNACSRQFKNESIEINPYCSFYLTSYIPEGITEVVMETGMLQRMLCYPKHLTTDDRRVNALQDVSNLGKRPAKETADFSRFVVKLKEIKDKYNHEDMDFDWTEVEGLFNQKTVGLLDLSQNADSEIKKVMETFHPRYMDQMYIIAMHHCCIRGDTVISVDDVEYASMVVTGCYRSLLSWFEEEPTMRTGKKEDYQNLRDIKTVFEEAELTEMSSGNLYNSLKAKWKKSDSTIDRRLAPLIESASKGYPGLEKRRNGRQTFYKLTA